jgi:hypothetical protein
VNAGQQSEALVAFLDALADRVAALVTERLLSGAPGMTDQASSPLGRRRHCAAVKRRLASGKPGAALAGRRHLLSAEALAEELSRVSGRPDSASPSPASGSVRAELERELRLVKGGAR